jgi:hypothetical protein
VARLMFGAGITDWTMTVESNHVLVAANTVVAFFDAQTGGNQLTDLTDATGSPLSAVTSSSTGQIPSFFGPDGVFELWASAAGGPRARMTASNLGSYLGPMRSQLEAHISGSNPNPHGTTVASLIDVKGMDAKQTGQVLAVDTDGKIKPTTVAGVGGSVTLTDDQSISGKKTFENSSANTVRVAINASESQAVDTLQVWSSTGAGQGGARVKTSAFNAKGEARFTSAKSDSVAVQLGQQSGQTANVLEQLNAAGTMIARMEPNGSWRAPNLGRSLSFSKAGSLTGTVGAGQFTFWNDTGVPLTVRSVRATVGTAPVGAAILIDVNLNGTTIFATQANRPTIAASAKTSGKVTGFSTSVIPDGGAITVDIDQVGTTTAGSDLAVQVDLY